MNWQIIVGLAVLAVVIGGLFGVLIAVLNRRFKAFEESQAKDQTWQILNQNIQGLQQSMGERLDNAARFFASLNEKVGQFSEIGRRFEDFQNLLRPPKQRGGLGEQGLKDMLSQALPPDAYRFQYKFRTGETVDAIIKVGAGIIPVDAKFPLENLNSLLKAKTEEEALPYRKEFTKAFKKYVTDIQKKYILPDEGTVDFAFLYLPVESAFFEVASNQPELYEFARQNRIVVASPSTFFYYLRTIMLGLEGQRINEMSKEILSTLKIIQQESRKFGEGLGILNRHITNAKNTMETVSSGYTRLSSKIESVSALEKKEEPELLEPTEPEETPEEQLWQ